MGGNARADPQQRGCAMCVWDLRLKDAPRFLGRNLKGQRTRPLPKGEVGGLKFLIVSKHNCEPKIPAWTQVKFSNKLLG